METYMAVL